MTFCQTANRRKMPKPIQDTGRLIRSKINNNRNTRKNEMSNSASRYGKARCVNAGERRCFRCKEHKWHDLFSPEQWAGDFCKLRYCLQCERLMSAAIESKCV